MASSSISDPPTPEDEANDEDVDSAAAAGHQQEDGEEKSVTIMYNDNREVFYDQDVLQSIIESNQPATRVTFIRVAAAGASSSGASSSGEFVADDVETLDVPGAAPPLVVDADPGLESLIVGDPSIVTGSSAAVNAGGVSANPILMLDQDQITRLENVLQSAEAKGMLGEVLVPGVVVGGGGGGASSLVDSEAALADLISGGDPLGVHVLDEVDMEFHGEDDDDDEEEMVGSIGFVTSRSSLDHGYTSEATSSVDRDDDNDGSVVKSGGNSRSPPKRRSQRQMDKEMKDEAERIRLENQALMRKEKEEANRKSAVGSDDPEKSDGGNSPIKSQKSPAGRPKRVRKIPAHLQSGDFESAFIGKAKASPKKSASSSAEDTATSETDLVAVKSPKEEAETSSSQAEIKPAVPTVPGAVKGEADDDDDEESDGDWNSEDDPDRLWCVCKQPHNNRFMICCDTCIDWYHGKCVGITKRMGKEMEEAGNEWRCPNCKKNEQTIKEEQQRDELAKKLKERENERKMSTDSAAAATGASGANRRPSGGKKITPIKRSDSSKSIGEKGEVEKKPKEKTCFVCDKPPRPESLYCSDDCIKNYVAKAHAAFSKARAGKAKPTESSSKSGSHLVMVMDPKANTILNGPSAPTEDRLESWLLTHPSYHVVMPSYNPTSKFYGIAKKPSNQPHRGPKVIPPPKSLSASQKSSLIDQKLAEYRKTALSSLSAARNSQQESGKKVGEYKRERSTESRKSGEGSSLKSSHVPPPRIRKDSANNSSTPVKKPVVKGETLPTPPPPPQNPKPIRDNAIKGIEDALKTRVEKSGDVTLEADKLKSLVRHIEEELFRLYSKDVGPKYKNKYRSLVFNIKDEKNNGLFRKIVSGRITARSLVNMTADEMASKELQQWRQAELKNDIEKIKSFELDQLVHGNKFVLKSHKGEQIIETAETSTKNGEVVKLPDDLREVPGENDKDPFSSWGSKTWEHGKHSFEPTCDVCTGKKTMDEFIFAKKERAKQREEKHRREKEKAARSKREKEHHRHHSSHSSTKDRHHHRSGSSSSHGHKGDKAMDKERDKDKNKERRKEGGEKSGDGGGKKDHEASRRSTEKGAGRELSEHHKKSSKEKSSKKEESEGSSSGHSHYHRSSSSSSSRHDKSSKSSHSKDELSKSVSSSNPYNPEEAFATVEEDAKAEEMRKKSLSEKVAKAEKILREFKDREWAAPEGTSSSAEVAMDHGAEMTTKGPGVTSSASAAASTSSEEVHVTSTVTISTPEQTAFDVAKENPIVWKGDIDMPDVAKFSVSAHAVSGTTDYLTVDLKDTLKIVGRIGPKTVWDYLVQVAETLGYMKEILVLRLEPSSTDERVKYDAFYNYLQSRSRFGVVGNNSRTVKDCYILPLSSDEAIHSCLLPLEGPGLEEARPNMLLALIVRSRRKRPGDSERVKYQEIRLKQKEVAAVAATSGKQRKNETPPLLTDDDIKDIMEMNEAPAKKKARVNEFVPYDPSSAGGNESSTPSPGEEEDDEEEDEENDEEVYDPESAFEEEPPPAKKKKNSEPQFSPPSVLDQIPGLSSGPITSDSGGFTEQLAKLAKEIEKQKAEIANMTGSSSRPSMMDTASRNMGSETSPAFSTDISQSEPVKGFQGLPTGIASILFGSSTSSDNTNSGSDRRDPRRHSAAVEQERKSLSAMSDADLLAKAQEMELPSQHRHDSMYPQQQQHAPAIPLPHHDMYAPPQHHDHDLSYPPPMPGSAPPYGPPSWSGGGGGAQQPPPLPPGYPGSHMGGPLGPPQEPWMHGGGFEPPHRQQQQQQQQHWPPQQQHHMGGDYPGGDYPHEPYPGGGNDYPGGGYQDNWQGEQGPSWPHYPPGDRGGGWRGGRNQRRGGQGGPWRDGNNRRGGNRNNWDGDDYRPRDKRRYDGRGGGGGGGGGGGRGGRPPLRHSQDDDSRRERGGGPRVENIALPPEGGGGGGSTPTIDE